MYVSVSRDECVCKRMLNRRTFAFLLLEKSLFHLKSNSALKGKKKAHRVRDVPCQKVFIFYESRFLDTWVRQRYSIRDICVLAVLS